MPGLRAFSTTEYQSMLDELATSIPSAMFEGEQNYYTLEVTFPDDMYEDNMEYLEDLAQRHGYEIFI